MPGLIVLLVLVGFGVMIFFLSRTKTERSASWVKFYTTGTESNFSLKEIEMLKRLSDKAQLEDPASIFSSQDQLDRCIHALVREIHEKGDISDTDSQNFLSKLYDYRKRIESRKPDGTSGISNSRQISEGQNVQILLEGYGVFKSQVIQNTSHHITLSKPNSTKLPGIFSWIGQRISVYFWREQDAGYVFDTEVTDEVITSNMPSLKIPHSDSLSRTQKRRSIRAKIHKSAFLYPLKNEESARIIETNPGVKCMLEDLSDTGCAITIGGKAEAGLRIKVQFALSNAPVVMSGTVRFVEYKPDTNKSLLHIEADPLTIETRNQVLGEVFGMLSEDEEDLPYRILTGEEKAAEKPQPELPEDPNLIVVETPSVPAGEAETLDGIAETVDKVEEELGAQNLS